MFPKKMVPAKKYLSFICTPSKKNIWTHLREPYKVSIKLENQNGSLFNMKCTKSFICTPSKNIWTHLREPHEVSIKLENQNGSLFNMKCTKFFYKWACARRNVFPLENGACATFEPPARTPSECVNPSTCTPLRIDHIRVYKVMWPPKFALTARMISFVPRTIAKTVPSFRKHSNPLREI